MERLKLQNSVFDDTLRFLGMATDDGVIVPIDCIPVRLPLGKRAFFEM